jgi:hypothetical protein
VKYKVCWYRAVTNWTKIIVFSLPRRKSSVVYIGKISITRIEVGGEFIFFNGDCPLVELYAASFDVLVAHTSYLSVFTLNIDKFYLRWVDDATNATYYQSTFVLHFLEYPMVLHFFESTHTRNGPMIKKKEDMVGWLFI